MTLAAKQIRDLLDEGWLLDGWSDMFSTDQPAPIVQMLLFNEGKLKATDRCILIRNSGSGDSTQYVQRQQFTIHLFGLNDAQSEAAIVNERADQINAYFLSNYKKTCIIGVNVLSDVMGPFLTDSGRPVFEINIEIILERVY